MVAHRRKTAEDEICPFCKKPYSKTRNGIGFMQDTGDPRRPACGNGWVAHITSGADNEIGAPFPDDFAYTPTGAENELVVATNLEFAPFEYTNGKKIAGIDMEIAQLLATYLNKTLVVVHMDFEAVVTTVSTKPEYDIGIAGLTITPERQEEVDFSDPYFGAAQCIVVAKDDTTFDNLTTAKDVENKLKELTGKAAKCGGQKATTSQFYVEGSEDFGFAGFKNLTFSGYKSAALAANDMLNGNIAFVVVDETTANALVKSITK